MTKFTGPLYVGRLDSDVTAVTIDVSGTAIFTGSVEVSGSVMVAGKIFDRSRLGQVSYSRKTTADSVTTAGAPVTFNAISGMDVTQFHVNVEAPFGALATAAVITINIAATLAAEIPVSASGKYTLVDARVVGDQTRFRNVTTTVEAYVSMQGLASAFSVGQCIFVIDYMQNG